MLKKKLQILEYIYEPIGTVNGKMYISKKSVNSPIMLLGDIDVPFSEELVLDLVGLEKLITDVLLDQATLHYMEMQKILNLTGVSQQQLVQSLEEFTEEIRKALTPHTKARLTIVREE